MQNFEKLQNNINNTKVKVEEFFQKNNDDQRGLKNIDQEIAEKVHSNQYFQIIDLLAERRDFNQNIKWQRNSQENGLATLIRDARNATDIKTTSPESKAMNGLANLLATKEIITEFAPNQNEEIANKKNDILKEIDKLSANVVNAALSDQEIDLKKLNSLLINSLKEIGVKDAKKMLFATKEFLHMSVPQYHVATVYQQKDGQGQNRTVVEADNLLLGLTEKQQKIYDFINQHGANGQKINLAQYQDDEITFGDQGDKLTTNDLDWYNSLSEFERKLVHSYSDSISQGNTALPTQLRSYLPGLRNGYEENIYLLNDSGELQNIGSAKHIGCLSAHVKGATATMNQEITDENAKQLQSFSSPQSRQVLQVLNSSTNIFNPVERTTHSMGEKAMEKVGNDTAKTPFNALRRLEGRKTEPYDQILTNIGEGLKDASKVADLANLAPNVDFAKIGNCLANQPFSLSKLFGYNRYGSSANKELKKLQEAAQNQSDLGKKEQLNTLATTLANCLKAKSEINTIYIIGSPDNINLTGKIKQIAHENNKGCLAQLQTPQTEVITQCASGKDRTGLAGALNTYEAINAHFGLNSKDNKSLIKENQNQQLNAGHQAIITDLNCGSIGCVGIKNETKNAIDNSAMKGQNKKINLQSSKDNKIKSDEKLKDTVISATLESKSSILGVRYSDHPIAKPQEKAVQEKVENIEISTNILKGLEAAVEARGPEIKDRSSSYQEKEKARQEGRDNQSVGIK